MRDKTETWVVNLTLAAALACGVMGTFVSLTLLYIGLAFTVLMWSYSVYWALDLRRLLSAPLYRNQALGAGLVSTAFASLNCAIYGGQNTSLVGNLQLIVIGYTFLITFYWVDSSVLAARKTDPLYRDTLHWRKVRLAVWPVIFVTALALPGLSIVYPSSLLQGEGVTWLFVILVFTPIIGAFGSGLILLPIAGRRSRDEALRKNLEWFGLFGASFILFAILNILSPGESEPGGGLAFFFLVLAFVAGSYCLYRSTKSLAPLNRLPSKKL